MPQYGMFYKFVELCAELTSSLYRTNAIPWWGNPQGRNLLAAASCRNDMSLHVEKASSVKVYLC